jgi:drug/metabolite transporter (DMT)-like permease
LALVVGVAAVSSSGVLIVVASASGLAIAFWRNAFATAVLAPVALTYRRRELRGWRTQKYSLLAGLALAVHFGTWVPSVKLTSVATATALGCSYPIWAGLIAFALGRGLSARVWLGIGVAVAGAVIAIGPDFGAASKTALLGDVLATIGGLSGAVYTILGERARQGLSTTTYTFVCYGVCAVALLPVTLLWGRPVLGFDTTTWAAIAALTAGAQLLGHSMFSYALHKVSATTVSVIVLLEVPGAAVLGWLFLDQVPSVTALIGIAILVAGVAVVVLSPGARIGRRRPPASVP